MTHETKTAACISQMKAHVSEFLHGVCVGSCVAGNHVSLNCQ